MTKILIDGDVWPVRQAVAEAERRSWWRMPLRDPLFGIAVLSGTAVLVRRAAVGLWGANPELSFYATFLCAALLSSGLLAARQAAVSRRVARETRSAANDPGHALQNMARLAQERQVMLQETNHRIGNHLQMIGGLLQKQARTMDGGRARTALHEAAGRIALLTRIHQRLYNPGGEESGFDVFLQQLCPDLVAAGADASVQCHVKTESVAVNAQHNVPLALIVNELVSNALEHGFAAGQGGRLHVRLRAVGEARLMLTVIDDGRGLPADFDPERTNSLGLQIVKSLTGQIGGRFTLSGRPGEGTMARLVFPAAGA